MSDASVPQIMEVESVRSKRSRQDAATEIIMCITTAADVTPSSVNTYEGGTCVAISDYVS